jgi:hypothetical protein
MTSYPQLDVALTDLGASNDRCRQALYYCDVTFMRPERRALRQDIQVSTYVFTGAAIEAFARNMVSGLADEINAQQIPLSDLALNLLSISHGGHLLALQDLRGLKMWRKRVELLTEAASQNVATLPGDYMPLDGRTIRPEHMETIWMVFGFSGDALPNARTGLALKMVADYRNLVAHGEADTSTVAGLQSIDDMLRLLERIDGLGIHFYDAAVDYLNKQLYLR